MEGVYQVLLGGQSVGKMRVERQGLYYRFSCRCEFSGEVIYKLEVTCGDRTESLGIPVPEGGAFVLGDNRPESGDSRMEYLRQIPCEDIKGTLFLRLSFHGREPTAGAERL